MSHTQTHTSTVLPNHSPVASKEQTMKLMTGLFQSRMNLRTASLALSLLYTAFYLPVLQHVHRHQHVTELSEKPTLLPSEGQLIKQTVVTNADGTFNGFPLYKIDEPPHTDVHCVGENFDDERGYMFRSCRFETFCFDTKDQEFVIYPDHPMNGSLYYEIWVPTHDMKNYTTVVAGAMNRDWWPVYAEGRDGIVTKIGRYQPKFVYPDSNEIPPSYYKFNATWLPFYRHQRSPYNPGHLVWDDFLALYTLLDIFDQADDKLLLSHMIRKPTFDFVGDAPLPDNDIIYKFLPLMGHHDYPLRTLEGDYNLTLNGKVVKRKGKKKRHIICADNALLGSGMFTDNGDHWHGDIESDYSTPHNNGRGGQFRRYREWLMNHIGVDPNTPMDREPYLIVVSVASSTKRHRKKMKFETQIDILKKSLGSRAIIKDVQLSNLSLVEQVELMSRAAVFISMVGGGTVTGTFLPKGASIILYHYDERFLDFDFWNNFPQIKAHWFPMENMTQDFSLATLAEVVNNQLDYLDRH